MQQILNGDKKAFNIDEVKKLYVPNYPELSIKNVYAALKDDEETMAYLPDIGKRMTERNFVWVVVNTLRPEFVKDSIKKAQAERRIQSAIADSKKQVIEVKPEILQKLAAANILRRKYAINAKLVFVIGAPVKPKNVLMFDRSKKAPTNPMKRKNTHSK